MQHKCIEPLGESKSDFQIFLDIAKRLGLGSAVSEARVNSTGASGCSTPPIFRTSSAGRNS